MSYEIGKEERWLVIDIRRLGQLSIAVLVTYYMWYNEKIGHNSLIIYGAFLVMCGSLVIDLIKDRETMFDDYYIGIWWNFVFAIYAFVTGVFVAYNFGAAVDGIGRVLKYSIVAFGIYYFSDNSKNGINWLLHTINVAALLCCFSLIMSPIEIIRGRFSISPWNNPNTLGFTLVIGIFAIAYNFKADIKWFIIFLPQIMLMMYGIIRTGSRKALISAIVFMFIWGIEAVFEMRKSQDSLKQTLVLVVFILIVIVGIRFVMSAYSQSEVSVRMESFFDDESNGNRINFYRLAWQILLDKPAFGGGINQFHYWSHSGSYAHSTYAEVLADFGIVGSLIYFFPIVGSGYELTTKIRNKGAFFQTKTVFVLWCVEILMGVGQIFYLDIMHYIAWTIIYINAADRRKIFANKRYRYIY